MKLLTTNNAKTIKGEKFGYMTFILYMAPNTKNSTGKNLCPMATKGCIASCLFTAGMGRFKNVENARIRKADYFIADRTSFLHDLYFDVNEAIVLAEREELVPVFRLNGTTDIQWENIKVRDDKNIFELFPEVTFYDYTKIVNRFNKNLPENYKLTFSYSKEADYYQNVDELSIQLMDKGINVSAVFKGTLPETFLGKQVVDGDISDLRFDDLKGVVVGLSAKGEAKKDTTGFVVDALI